MLSALELKSDYISQPRYVWFLTLSFAMIIAISNWYDARLVSIFGIVVTPGSLTYPLSFLISDCLTEVYGFKNARLAMWATLFFNVLFVLFGQLVIHLPSPSFATDNDAFNKLLNMNVRIIIASFCSFLAAEPINSFIIAKIKIWTEGRYVAFRFLISSVFASLLDTALFVLIAFAGSMGTDYLVKMIINVSLIKISVELLFIPFSIRISRFLKNKEELDIYDTNTKFNVFSLDTKYQPQNNRFKTN